jgi:hypothetical protein
LENSRDLVLAPQQTCILTFNSTTSFWTTAFGEMQMSEEFRPVQIRFTRNELTELDDWRRRQEGEIPSRSTAMRILMQRALHPKKREPALREQEVRS